MWVVDGYTGGGSGNITHYIRDNPITDIGDITAMSFFVAGHEGYGFNSGAVFRIWYE